MAQGWQGRFSFSVFDFMGPVLGRQYKAFSLVVALVPIIETSFIQGQRPLKKKKSLVNK